MLPEHGTLYCRPSTNLGFSYSGVVKSLYLTNTARLTWYWNYFAQFLKGPNHGRTLLVDTFCLGFPAIRVIHASNIMLLGIVPKRAVGDLEYLRSSSSYPVGLLQRRLQITPFRVGHFLLEIDALNRNSQPPA
jgi:hypothetical protein